MFSSFCGLLRISEPYFSKYNWVLKDSKKVSTQGLDCSASDKIKWPCLKVYFLDERTPSFTYMVVCSSAVEMPVLSQSLYNMQNAMSSNFL